MYKKGPVCFFLCYELCGQPLASGHTLCFKRGYFFVLPSADRRHCFPPQQTTTTNICYDDCEIGLRVEYKLRIALCGVLVCSAPKSFYFIIIFDGSLGHNFFPHESAAVKLTVDVCEWVTVYVRITRLLRILLCRTITKKESKQTKSRKKTTTSHLWRVRSRRKFFITIITIHFLLLFFIIAYYLF